MVPGKTYRPEDFLEIAWRRKWWLAVPFILIASGTFLYTKQLPELYRSSTTVMVLPQRVPETYVRATVRQSIEDRLNSMRTQIMSRTRLEAIITDLDLYPEQRRSGALMEDIVEQMRRDIGIETLRNDTFRVSFVSRVPQTAMHVTERLAQLFIDENLRQREALAQGANQFIGSQLEEARQRLIEHEKRLEDYRRLHAGELPDQLDANLTAISSTQMQLQNVVEAQHRDRDRRQVVQRMITEITDPLSGPQGLSLLSMDVGGPLPAGSVAQQLDAARRALDVALVRLKPTHPDVLRLERIIADLEKKAEQEAERAPLSVAGQLSPGDQAKAERLSELEMELASLDKQIAERSVEERRLRGRLGEYQQRADAAPTRETELIELTRDYTTIQQLYRNLLQKSQEVKMSADLESRQIGEQFRIIDPARVPQRPFSPNRPRLNGIGAIIGLAVGLFFVGLLEYRDTSLKTDEDVLVALSLPVLALVPTLTTAAERLRRRKIRVALAAGSAVLVFLVVAVAAVLALRA